MDQMLLLEESSKTQIPEHFAKFIQNVIYERSNIGKENKKILEIFSLENDFIMCILLTVTLECGFRYERSLSCDFDISILRETTSIPKWKDPEKCIYRMDLFLAPLSNYRFLLVIIPVFGQTVLINMLTLMKDKVISSAVQALIPSQWINIFGTTLPEKFNNLYFLARILKTFFQNVKDYVMNKEQITNPSLIGIPEELKRNIFKLLSVQDFVRLTSTCRPLNTYSKDQQVWKHFLKKQFAIDAEDPYDTYVFRHTSNRVILTSFQDNSDEYLHLYNTFSDLSMETIL